MLERLYSRVRPPRAELSISGCPSSQRERARLICQGCILRCSSRESSTTLPYVLWSEYSSLWQKGTSFLLKKSKGASKRARDPTRLRIHGVFPAGVLGRRSLAKAVLRAPSLRTGEANLDTSRCAQLTALTAIFYIILERQQHSNTFRKNPEQIGSENLAFTLVARKKKERLPREPSPTITRASR